MFWPHYLDGIVGIATLHLVSDPLSFPLTTQAGQTCHMGWAFSCTTVLSNITCITWLHTRSRFSRNICYCCLRYIHCLGQLCLLFQSDGKLWKHVWQTNKSTVTIVTYKGFKTTSCLHALCKSNMSEQSHVCFRIQQIKISPGVRSPAGNQWSPETDLRRGVFASLTPVWLFALLLTFVLMHQMQNGGLPFLSCLFVSK